MSVSCLSQGTNSASLRQLDPPGGPEFDVRAPLADATVCTGNHVNTCSPFKDLARGSGEAMEFKG